MKKVKIIFILLMVSVFLVACASFVKNSYITMDSTGVTYNVVMTGVGATQTTGKISPEQRAVINKYGLIFFNGYQVAVTSLAAYKLNPADNTQTAVTLAVTTLLSNWVEFANLVNSIMPGTVPISSINAISLKGKTIAGEKFEVSIKRLDTGEISVIIQIGAAVLQYLIPAVQSLINDMGKITISVEDIQALKTLIKPPDQY